VTAHTRLVLVLGALQLSGVASAHAARVEIILDVSGSMKAPLGGETRMDAARKAIRATLAGIQADSVVALRLYGHRVGQDDKAGSCRDTELAVPFQPLDKAGFLAVVERATPRGQTPLTYSLEQAARDFGPASDEERVIILVSDGAESCGGDPTAAARALLAQGFKVKVHTVGFDVDAAARAQLEALSAATGGEYHDARNAAVLADSLTRLAQKALLVNKTEEAATGQPIRGGDGYDSAVPLQSGVVYRLDHHQRQDQYDYFYLPLQGAHRVRATIQTTHKGIEIKGDSFKEGEYPYAALTLHDTERRRRGVADVIGDKNTMKTLEGLIDETHGDRLYVLIGSSHNDQHKDSRFQVTLTARPGDAGTPSDAGATPAESLAITLGSYNGELAENDKVDFFRFSAHPQVSYRVVLRSRTRSNLGDNLEISAENAEGDVLDKTLCFQQGQPATLKALTLPGGGPVFLRVAYQLSGSGEDSYALEVARADGSTTPAAVVASGGPAPSAGGAPAPSLLNRLVYFFIWSGVPLVFGLLVGGVGGYLFGRRARP
jgi:hypothetical protein